MTSFEWLAVVYFGFVAVSAPRTRRSVRGWIYAAAASALAIVAGFAAPPAVRAWLPHAYLVLGYWIPAAFTPEPRDARFERWLVAADRRLFRYLTRVRHVSDSKVGERTGLELAYLLCYPLVPTAFAVVYLHGTLADIERFWLAVLLAGYCCYGTLRWTAARPPRLVTPRETTGALAALNVWVLGRVSHRLNTFPSGHVAVSAAAALVVARVSPGAGLVVGVIAIAIAAAAVAGRYHYLVDVLIGLLLGAVIGLSAFA